MTSSGISPMRLLVLGGGGYFGRLVVAELAADSRYRVVAAGRRAPAAPLPCPFARLEVDGTDLPRRIAELAPRVIIHCAGPFEPDRYGVVEAALACGSHYLDLAEHRGYVTGISRFDGQARAAGLAVLSGVSSVPALSSAVVAAHRGEFSRLSAVDIGITSSERLPGLGAVRSVLAQCGQPFSRWGAGAAEAWTDSFRVRLPAPVGSRLLGSCDVPDLEVLSAAVPGLDRVTFRAGVASFWLMRGLRVFALLRRRGWIARPQAWAGPVSALSRLFRPFGNGASGMFVRLFGRSITGEPLVVRWQLTAADHQGVRVPARGVVAMVDRLYSGIVPAGARPCCMELSVAAYLGARLPVTIRVDRLEGAAACADEQRWRV